MRVCFNFKQVCFQISKSTVLFHKHHKMGLFQAELGAKREMGISKISSDECYAMQRSWTPTCYRGLGLWGLEESKHSKKQIKAELDTGSSVHSRQGMLTGRREAGKQ